MEEAAMLAEQMGVPLADLLGGAELPKAVVARKYVKGEPMVSTERYQDLPTHMRNLHDWYMTVVKEGRERLVANVAAEYYFYESTIHVEFDEFFQLFNQDALDKGLVSCYCL